MRTTVTLAPDVAAALAQVQSERGLGVSAALNELVRRGLLASDAKRSFQQRSYDVGLKLDVRNVGEALDVLDDPSTRGTRP